MSGSRTNIPRFGSFRPKPAAPITSTVSKEEGTRTPASQENIISRDGEKRHRRPHRSKSPKRRPPVERSPSPKRPETFEIFVVDRKGDEKNLVYGSVHRYAVPPFHRAGAGSVLGISRDFKIDRDYGDDKFIILSNLRHPKSREKYAFARIEKERPRLLKIRPEAMSEDLTRLQVDFLPLQVTRGKEGKRLGDMHSSSSDNETGYRSIHGKAKAPKEPLDDAFMYASESESSDFGGKTAASARQKNVDLSRKVEKYPHKLEAWLDLIRHQDELLRGRDERRIITNAELRSTADIKIHMYEKALEKARSLSDRESLLQGMMDEGSKIWEVKVQSDKWEQISKENINSLLLWKSYLNFKQTTFSTFRYEGIRGVYIQRIKLLLEVIPSAGMDASESLYKQLLYVLLRFTIFVRESGYTELAVAIWQVLLEINFCAPDGPLSNSETTKLFQEFWDSEVPRIGEEHALGWQRFASNPDAVDFPDPVVDEAENTLDDAKLFESWAVAERIRSTASRIPAKTMDEVVEDDPFRVILFADIEDFLITLPKHSDDLQKSLLDAFLLFCRLPPMPGQGCSSEWYKDAFVRGELLELDAAWTDREYSRRTHTESADISILSALNTSFPHFSSSPETFFAGTFWFNILGVWRDRYVGDNGPVAYNWVRNILKQLTQMYFRGDFAEYYLAFEWRNEPDSIKKIAKSLLKQHSDCVRLYNAYAMIEWHKGNREVAGAVFSAALSITGSLPDSSRKDSILLWKSWIWACMEIEDYASALKHILSISYGIPNTSVEASPTLLIRAKQYLSSNRDYLLSSGDTGSARPYTECLAILEYLSTQRDIASALATFAGISQNLSSRNLANTVSHELLLQSAARLLFHHARIGPFRPALLREHLTHYMSFFPQNTILLALYSWNESRLRIDNRLRNLLTLSKNESLVSRMFQIKWELEHGTIHSVRSTFENALSSSICQSSSGIWRLYILFCLDTPQFRSHVKDIWYRGLRGCPWAKELYITGFELDIEKIEFSELKSTWKVMGEKELRVHVDLEDRFEDLRLRH